MKPERWQRVTDLFQSAIGREPDQRAVYLDGVCAGDDSLRQEVEALIAAHEQADSFIEQPAFEIEAATLAADHVGSMVGRALGHYQLISLLGYGGMGEVYLAQDTRLGRKVAVKLLPALFTTDEPRVRRFRQEAQSASALNHPNIVTIYEFGEKDDLQFIVSELVEGETLRERIARMQAASSPAQRAPDSLSEVLDLAIQVASALAAAHQAGIIHRDIKPENIMLRRDGYVKVLDFGLAKLSEKATDQRALDSEAATKVLVRTSPGLVMGSAEYMSPEQSRGQEVDARTDIWSLGVVLYELVTGCAPFTGETPTDVIASIVKTELPPLTQIAPEAPAELERIVSKTLAKDREERYQGVKDLLVDLRQLRKRLDVASELERTASLEMNVQPTTTSSEQATIATAQGAATQTSVVGVARQTSSAEYVVGEIKQHKVATLITLVMLAAGIIGLTAYLRARNTEVAIESIAVLPFTNQSGNTDVEYLSDGITESLINSLSQLPSLSVKARSTVFHYKGKDVTPQQVGSELSVQAVLNGRVTQRGDQLTLNLELVDARTGDQIWGEQYNRKTADLVSLQSEIARDVSNKLRVKLSGADEQKLARNYTENAEAYQLYLKGNYYSSKYTKDGLRKGVDYFNQALAADPNYALAYNGVADYYITSVDWYLSPSEAMPKAREAANKALAIDENLADAHTSLATVAWWYDWDTVTAEREYRRAIELNPKASRSREFYSWYLVTLGRVDEALAQAREAVRLDPVSPEMNTNLGQVFLWAHQYDQAIEQFRSSIELDSSYFPAHDNLGRAYEAEGKLAEAIAEFQRALQIEDGAPENWSNLGHAYALSGKASEAQTIIERLKRTSASSYVPPYNVAVLYAGLGDKNQAFDWLNRAYDERSFYLAAYLKVDSQMDNLRSDSRFKDLLRRMKLSS